MNTVEAKDQVSLGDKNVDIQQFERYKGRKGQTDRIGFVSKTLLRGWRFYVEAKRASFRAPTDPVTLKRVTDVLGQPEQRFALVLFHYATDDKGALLDEAKCAGKLKLWVLSEARYLEISNLAREWPLLDSGPDGAQHDLMVTCTEEKYQRMQFQPTKNAQWKTKPNWYEAISEKAKSATAKLPLALGRQLNDAEIIELLGLAPATGVAPGSTAHAGDIDLSDIVGNASP